MLKKIETRLNRALGAREKALRVQRETIPLCAAAIKDIHRNQYAAAAAKVKKVKKKIAAAERILRKYPEIRDSVLGAAYQEYAELGIFLSCIKTQKLPKPDVPAKYYLLGLGDAIGELKRAAVDMLGRGKLAEAEKLEADLEKIYANFVSLSYPNAIVPGLKRKQDIARAVLNALHDQIAAHKIARR